MRNTEPPQAGMRAFNYKFSLEAPWGCGHSHSKEHGDASSFAAKKIRLPVELELRPLPHNEMLYGYFEVQSASQDFRSKLERKSRKSY